jgi:CDP-diacylglycerol--glycerol-3-phosphate 3-phosphatidyltransferase
MPRAAGQRCAAPTRGEYFDRWSALHAGFDPRRSFLVGLWLGWTHTVARPLVAARVAPDLITLAGLAAGAAVVGFTSLGGRWVFTAGALVVASALLDNLDGAVAVMTDRATRWGSVLDSVTDRVCDGLFLTALWVLGAPGWLCVLGGTLMGLHEYTRARAAAAGMSEIGVITVWERPTRVIVTAVFLGCAGSYPGGDQGWATLAAAAWLGLGLVGLGQLLVVVRHRLMNTL